MNNIYSNYTKLIKKTKTQEDIINIINFLEQNVIDKDIMPFSKCLVNKIKHIEKKISKSEGNVDDEMNKISTIKSNYFGKLHTHWVKKLAIAKKTINAELSKNEVIKFENVIKYYKNFIFSIKVLKGIDLSINKGDFVVILGPSGSGKTTLLNILSGMDKASYGVTNVCGNNLINLNEKELTTFRRNHIGYVFQQYGLLPNLTVYENVEIGQFLQKNKDKRLEIKKLLEDMNIYTQRNKYPYELSGGQQQRVSIARSIAKNPDILFADEPTGAVDSEATVDILKLFKQVNKQYNTTIIIVTHNDKIAEIANKIIIVQNGLIKKVIKNNPKDIDKIEWSVNFDKN